MAQPKSESSDADLAPATPEQWHDKSTPTSPGSEPWEDDSASSTPLDPPSPSTSPKRVPSLRTVSDPQGSATHMSSSSTVTGTLNSARRPPVAAGLLPGYMLARAVALQTSRLGSAPSFSSGSSGSSFGSPMSGGPASPLIGHPGMPQNPRLPPNMTASLNMGSMGNIPNLGNLGAAARPVPAGFPKSAPEVPSARKPTSLSERRQMKLGGFPGAAGSPVRTPQLSDIVAGGGSFGKPGRPKLPVNSAAANSKMNDFKNYIDAEKGWITFEGAATITSTGVNFASGQKFSISLDEIDVLDELGKGNYGTVYKVRHARPRYPRFGQGLSSFKKQPLSRQTSLSDGADPFGTRSGDSSEAQTPLSPPSCVAPTSGRVMAMKEIRLELDEAKFTTILKELVILHECVSPHIIDFYGAFFQEGAVYMCIEFMDGGSIDKLYAGGIPENVIRKITLGTVLGLKELKEKHNIIHRDVKPTNILANTRGQVKICDFGVSGNLVASIAKTNIGCQSYMAPERISGGAMMSAGSAAPGTYSVQSDIWSLGLTIIECAMGRYPYPPEVSSTIFSQLSAIVEGEPPDLPAEGYSPTARDFVRSCLNKIPAKRSTYPMLLMHPWLKPLTQPATISEETEEEDDGAAAAAGKLTLEDGSALPPGCDEEVGQWVRAALEKKRGGQMPRVEKPALHAAPLDTVSPSGTPRPSSDF